MENKIKAAFDGILMPDDCTEKIEEVMKHQPVPRSTRRPGWCAAAAVACLLLVLGIYSNPTIVRALEEVFVPVTFGMDNAFCIDSNWFSYYKNGTGCEGDHNWIVPSGSLKGRLDTEPWLVLKNDRLYFTANGEMIDITDRISLETPFTYTYVDKQDLIHYLAVGGIFEADGGVESVGTIEYVRHKLVLEANPGSQDAGWLCQLLRGSDLKNMDDEFFPWIRESFKILELPQFSLEYTPEKPTIPER